MKEEYIDEDLYFDDEEEKSSIDIMAMLKRLWSKRKFIIIFTSCFMVLGLLIAIFSQPIYKSSCTFVPQMGSKKSSSLSSLAALAGMSTLELESGSSLSPLIYPQLMENADLQRELIYSKLHFEDFDEPVSLFDYFMNPDFQKPSVADYVFTYTYGWPLFLLSSILPQQEEEELGAGVASADGEGGKTSRINFFTKDECDCLKIIDELTSVSVDKKDGYLTLECKMNEKLASAELCEVIFNLLEKYITIFKIEKAKQNLEYIQGRYEEVRRDYEQKQMALAEFNDANRGTLSATSQTRRDQLQADYNLAYSIFSDMSKQYIQAEMQVKEDQPVLSVVKSIVVAPRRSNSRVLMVIIWTFLGGVLSIGAVMGLDLLKKKGSKWPEWWTLENADAVPEEEKK